MTLVAVANASAANMASSALPQSDETHTVVFVSQGGNEFRMTPEAASLSGVVAVMLEGSPEGFVFDTAAISSDTLAKVVEFCNHFSQFPSEPIAKPMRSKVLTEAGVSQWDSDFISVSQPLLFEIIKAANFLDIKPLLDLAAAKVASLITATTPAEIRAIFSPPQAAPLTEEGRLALEAQIAEENAWAAEA